MTQGRVLVYTKHTDMQSIFISKIHRIGTSLGIVIPVEILRAYNWQRGDFVIFGFAGGEQLLSLIHI